MSRYFMIQSWVGSHENEPDYNGQQAGERNVRSIEAVPLYDQFGNANVSAFSDEAIAARNGTKKPTKVSLKQRILPQSSRVEKLHAEILELESAYRSGEFSPEDYTVLRDVAFKKLKRAEEMLKRAIKPVEKVDETDEDEAISNHSSSFTNEDVCVYPFEESALCGVDFIDELSDQNSLKKILQIACKLVRTVRYYSQQAATYYRTLKEL